MAAIGITMAATGITMAATGITMAATGITMAAMVVGKVSYRLLSLRGRDSLLSCLSPNTSSFVYSITITLRLY